MEFVQHLGSGLAWVNKFKGNQLAAAGFSLGKMHVMDIKIANVDRLPWRGNNYTGHPHNVFTDLITGKAIGIDTEKKENLSPEMKEAVQDELYDIKFTSGFYKYASTTVDRLTQKRDKNKLTLEGVRKEVFKREFAEGLKEALKE